VAACMTGHNISAFYAELSRAQVDSFRRLLEQTWKNILAEESHFFREKTPEKK
jgi:hypothetical protein